MCTFQNNTTNNNNNNNIFLLIISIFIIINVSEIYVVCLWEIRLEGFSYFYMILFLLFLGDVGIYYQPPLAIYTRIKMQLKFCFIRLSQFSLFLYNFSNLLLASWFLTVDGIILFCFYFFYLLFCLKFNI